MRLLNRTACEIRVAARRVIEDGLGGRAEGFSDELTELRGNVGFVSNSLNSTANALMGGAAGVRTAQTLRLRFMGDVGIHPGDGVLLPGEEAVCWRCVEVSRYPLMTVARVERIAGADGP